VEGDKNVGSALRAGRIKLFKTALGAAFSVLTVPCVRRTSIFIDEQSSTVFTNTYLYSYQIERRGKRYCLGVNNIRRDGMAHHDKVDYTAKGERSVLIFA